MSVRMCFRMNGGARHDVPGSWTCMVCNMGGCWPVRQSCFRCGSARGTGPSIPAGREMRYPGEGSGGSVNIGNPTTRQPKPKPGTVGPRPSPLLRTLVAKGHLEVFDDFSTRIGSLEHSPVPGSWLARRRVDVFYITLLLWLPRCPIRPFFKRSVVRIRNFEIEFSAWNGCCA